MASTDRVEALKFRSGRLYKKQPSILQRIKRRKTKLEPGRNGTVALDLRTNGSVLDNGPLKRIQDIGKNRKKRRCR